MVSAMQGPEPCPQALSAVCAELSLLVAGNVDRG